MLQLEIVTPTEKLLAAACESVALPGAEGEFEVYEGHTPVLSSLKAGTLTAKYADGTKFDLRITQGFVEVAHQHVTVMCERAADGAIGD